MIHLLLSYVWDPVGDPVAFAMAVARLALLLSPAMLRYLAARPPSAHVAELQ